MSRTQSARLERWSHRRQAEVAEKAGTEYSTLRAVTQWPGREATGGGEQRGDVSGLGFKRVSAV